MALSLGSADLLAQGILRRTYYDDEKKVIKEEFFVDDTIKNQLTGSYVSYYLSGKMKSQGHYAYNRPVGDWVYYFENGSIRQSGSFMRGKTIGIWTNYYENGNKRSEGILVKNLKAGEWTYFFEDGGVKSTGEYLDNLKEGTWEYFYADGVKKAQAIFQKGSGIYQEFYVSGKLKMEGLNKLGKSDSLWTYYFETGEKLAEGYYKEGLKAGPWKYFFKNGNKSAEGGYENGKTIGNWIYYYDDGVKSAEGLQKNGVKDGYWKMFYETGETKGVGEFNEGTGEYTEYYTSGKVKVRGQFKEDLNHGHWTYFDEEGNLEGEADFEEGVGDFVGYYQNGNKKMSGMITQGKRTGEWTLYKKNGEIAGKYHPIYEDESPIFLTAESLDDGRNKDYEKPDYRHKNKKLRYFTPRINEYRGVILGTNPVFSLAGFWPISLEYYMQERQGIELTSNIQRNPFFISDQEINVGDHYTRGTSWQLKQKFYSHDQKLGMFYFGHFVGMDFLTHYANTEITTIDTRAEAQENRFYYGLMVGDRWIRDPGNAGFTVDVFFGVGIGKRTYTPKYSDSSLDPMFEGINQSSTVFPIVFGLNIGYLGIRKIKNKPVPVKVTGKGK